MTNDDQIVFDMAMRYYNAVYDRMDKRISQMWNARYTAWGLLVAIGAFFLQPFSTPQDSGPVAPSPIVKIGVPILCLAICIFHWQFERLQEMRIAGTKKPGVDGFDGERLTALKWLAHAEALLIRDASSVGIGVAATDAASFDWPTSVGNLRLWILSFILATAISILLWVH